MGQQRYFTPAWRSAEFAGTHFGKNERLGFFIAGRSHTKHAVRNELIGEIFTDFLNVLPQKNKNFKKSLNKFAKTIY